MNLDEAFSKHAEWKVKFRTAISKQETLDAATIGKDDCCALGTWLHGAGRARFNGQAAFTDLVAKHRTFHAEAGKVAKLINDKKFAEADKALESGTSYAAASSQVGIAISSLKKIA